MPTLDKHQSQDVVKLLLLGDSGAGKTGLLATLPPAGYRLIIADFDNGLDILKDPKVLPEKYHSQVHFETFYDKHSTLGGILRPEVKSYTDFAKYMNKWKDDSVPGGNLGGLHDWGSNDVFVIDSLTFLGEGLMREALKLSGHIGQRPSQPDWGTAIDLQESIIEMLYNPAVKCNVIVTSHLMRVDDEMTGVGKRYPTALGRKLPTKLARYFNNVVLVEKLQKAGQQVRQLQTIGTALVDLKVSKPSKTSSVMEPDLAKLFEVLKGPAAKPVETPKEAAASPTS